MPVDGWAEGRGIGEVQGLEVEAYTLARMGLEMLTTNLKSRLETSRY